MYIVPGTRTRIVKVLLIPIGALPEDHERASGTRTLSRTSYHVPGGWYDLSENMRASHWGIVLALPVLFIDEVTAAFGPGDALAAHRQHQREAFGRRQGAATKLSDNAAKAIGGGYQEMCKAKLRAANINPDDFEFAPELPGDKTAGGELRVVWMNENPHCFKRRHGRCVPLFERDWLYDWLLRDVPVCRL